MTADSALVVPFLELEPVVRRHRLRHDPHAALGVPAHVTIHFPWVPAAGVDPEALDRVRALASAVQPFEVTFVETRWFGSLVLWLAPEPDRPFRDLSDRSAALWPQAPRYGGEFDEIIPHLTIGDLSHGGDEAGLRSVQPDLVRQLPLRATAAEIWWMRQAADGRWSRGAGFPLGG